jgi:hypothetical protein
MEIAVRYAFKPCFVDPAKIPAGSIRLPPRI